MKLKLAEGTVLDGKYRIQRALGHGGMSTVFEAVHTETRKRVALKCIKPADAPDPESTARLVREAQAAARIRHPNVVDVYDVRRDGDLVFLVMEYLEGEPLSNILRASLPVYRLIALLLPAMRGVAEAHRQGVVHRDIKPDNIFMSKQLDTREPVPKVLDFGISKLDGRGEHLRALTAAGKAIGTPRYMSYEQVTGSVDIDGRVDVYAFGVILYEAMTGRVPYDADTFSELLVRMSVQSVPPPASLRRDLPDALSRIVMWALERERDQRIPSLEALMRELEPFATERAYAAEFAVQAVSLANAQTRPGGFGFGAAEGLPPSAAVTAAPSIEPGALLPRMAADTTAPCDAEARDSSASEGWVGRHRRRKRALAISMTALGMTLFAMLLWSLRDPLPARTSTAPSVDGVARAQLAADRSKRPADEAVPRTLQPIPASPTPASSLPPPQPTAARSEASPRPSAQPQPQRPAPSPKLAARKPRDFGIY